MIKKLAWIFMLSFAAFVMVASATSSEGNRVPLVSEHPKDPRIAKIFDDLRAHHEEILNTYRMNANAPELYLAARDYVAKLRSAPKMPRHYRELAILRTTQIENGHYEYVHHVAMAQSCGISQAQLNALPNWRGTNVFDPKERAVLAFTEGMTTRVGPDDATFRTLASYFSSQEIVELAMTNGYYISNSHIGNALGLPLEPDRGAGSIPHGC